MATWDIDRIASKAYQAYERKKVNNKNYQGKPMPGYYDLPMPIKEAWHAAVLYVVSHMQGILEEEIQKGD